MTLLHRHNPIVRRFEKFVADFTYDFAHARGNGHIGLPDIGLVSDNDDFIDDNALAIGSEDELFR
jgi:hypothetical protein